MAKYWLDAEFIEGFRKPLFGKRRHFIDLISIALVCEDGRTYSAISEEYNYHQADEWVQKNVIQPLYEKQSGVVRSLCDAKTLNHLIGKPNKEIALEIFNFVNPDLAFHVTAYNNSELKNPEHRMCKHFDLHNVAMFDEHYYAQPTFISYFPSYDWVLFCSLFGRMINLPKGFPMFPIDIKQMMEERGLTKEWKDINCPEPADTHDALADALWHKQLYEAVINHKIA